MSSNLNKQVYLLPNSLSKKYIEDIRQVSLKIGIQLQEKFEYSFI